MMRNGDVENEQVLSTWEIIYKKLAELEDDVLSKQRFLLGQYLTAVDIRMTMTLLRWDSSYRGAFFLTGGRGGILISDGYPNLKAYVRDVYAVIKPAVDFTAFQQYYRIRQALQQAHRVQYPQEGENIEADEPLADLKEIIDSAGEPAGPRPGTPNQVPLCCF